jgi:hypothetical protein
LLKIRKWCPLCLSVQLVIIIESVIAFNKITLVELNIPSFIPILIIFSIVFIIVLLLKLLFVSDRIKENIKLELFKMKRDPEIFLSKLKKGERIDIPSSEYALVFGEAQSEVLISVFLSFHCSACAKRFESVLKMIDNNSKIAVQLILSPAIDEISVRLLKTIFLFIKSGQNTRALEELKTWFSLPMKTKSKLRQNNDIRIMSDGFENMINYNSSLFDLANIVTVPSIYVNGFKLPDTYYLEEIRFHISELKKIKLELLETEI